MYLSRDGIVTWAFQTVSNTIRIYSSSSENLKVNALISLNFDCGIIMPPSSQPSACKFIFIRSGSEYLILTSTLIAQPLLFSSTVFKLTLATYEMVVKNTYNFTLTINSKLSSNAKIVIVFPPEVGFTSFSNTCSGKYNSLTLMSITSCMKVNGTNTRIEIIVN